MRLLSFLLLLGLVALATGVTVLATGSSDLIEVDSSLDTTTVDGVFDQVQEFEDWLADQIASMVAGEQDQSDLGELTLSDTPDPLHLGDERMKRLMKLYETYSQIAARVAQGKANRGDVNKLKKVKSDLKDEYDHADSVTQAKTKPLYDRVQGLLDKTIEKAEEQVKKSFRISDSDFSDIPESEMMFDSPLATVPITSTAYVTKTGSDNLFEIISSRAILAIPNISPVVASLARKLIKDHSMLQQKAAMTLMRLGMSVTPKLDPTDANLLKTLLATPVSQREQEFLRQQLVGHQADLKLQQTYATTGTNPALVALAQSAIPVISHHLELVQKIIALASLM